MTEEELKRIFTVTPHLRIKWVLEFLSQELHSWPRELDDRNTEDRTRWLIAFIADALSESISIAKDQDIPIPNLYELLEKPYEAISPKGQSNA